MTYILAFSNTPCLRKRSWSGRNVNYGLTGYELSNELGYPTGYHTNDKNQNTGNRNLEKKTFSLFVLQRLVFCWKFRFCFRIFIVDRRTYASTVADHVLIHVDWESAWKPKRHRTLRLEVHFKMIRTRGCIKWRLLPDL